MHKKLKRRLMAEGDRRRVVTMESGMTTQLTGYFQYREPLFLLGKYL